MKAESNGKSRWLSLAITVASMLFGAGGATMVLRADVNRHEHQIEALKQQTAANDTVLARIDERLKNIEQDIADIKQRLFR